MTPWIMRSAAVAVALLTATPAHAEHLPADTMGSIYEQGSFRKTRPHPTSGRSDRAARTYDGQIGRFLQTDPVGYEDDLNLYAYVRNDPLNMTDPTGRESASFAVGDYDPLHMTPEEEEGMRQQGPPAGRAALVVGGCLVGRCVEAMSIAAALSAGDAKTPGLTPSQEQQIEPGAQAIAEGATDTTGVVIEEATTRTGGVVGARIGGEVGRQRGEGVGRLVGEAINQERSEGPPDRAREAQDASRQIDTLQRGCIPGNCFQPRPKSQAALMKITKRTPTSARPYSTGRL